MPDYHLYCLDHDGRDVETEMIQAPSDEEAVMKAQALKGLLQCEVWRNNRLVARITDFPTVEP